MKMTLDTLLYSLLKLANYTVQEGEAQNAFQHFHDDHEPKMASGTFLITTSSLLKLANYTIHEGETDFSVSMRAMTTGHFSLSLLLHLLTLAYSIQHYPLTLKIYTECIQK